jgi:hypothetical protein
MSITTGQPPSAGYDRMNQGMTQEEHQRLFELFTNPPPGSKIAEAKEFGIDLTLNLRSLAMTPTERSRAMENALRLVEELERAGRRAGTV